MGTLVYTPAVEVHISTANGRIYDVSADVVSGSADLITNGVSSASVTIQNAGRKYDGVFDVMDRIIIYMTRIKRLLVFSGYLDSVPAFSSIPASIVLQASCTLKRLQYWSWDPTTDAAYRVLYLGDVANRSDLTDGGLAARTVRLLSQVAGWPQSQIHIGAIPQDWFTVVAGVARDLIGEATRLQLISHVGSNAYISGTSTIEKGTQQIKGIGAGTGDMPDIGGTLGVYDQSVDLADTKATAPGASPYFITMRWPYLQRRDQFPGDTRVQSVPGVNTIAARTWWMGRRILVVNPANSKAVCLTAVGWGPIDYYTQSAHVADSSAKTLSALGLPADGGEVNLAFAPTDMAVGPVDTSTGSLVTSGGSTSGSSLATGLGTALAGSSSAVKFADTAAAWCRKHQGRDYVWGGKADGSNPDPSGLDCSGLTAWAHARIGAGHLVDGAAQQYTAGRAIPVSQARTTKGALLFVTDDGNAADIHHVGISLGDGTTAEARSTQDGGGIFPFTSNRWTQAALVPDLDYTGTGSTGAGGNPTGTGGSGDPAPSFGQSLFNVFQWIGSTDFGGDLLGGIRALMNDKPILDTVGSLMTAGLRQFCSAPNGDFIAWFPDYFGWWGTAAKMVIQPIEIQEGFSVAKSDGNLKTHWFVTSSTTGIEGFGDATAIYQQYSTAGIASVEFPPLMRALFKNSDQFDDNGKAFLRRFGARPVWEPMDNITGPRQEFFFAVFRFMLNWASQFSATLPLTFLPELYPGMLAVLPVYGVQAYVQEVHHTWDLRPNSGGFATRANCIAWSTIGKNEGIKGLPEGSAL